MANDRDRVQDYIVLAIEHGEGKIPITLPSGEKIEEYNYLMTPRHVKGSLLALIMSANNNNKEKYWYKLTIRLQRYLARQVCTAVFNLHTQDRIAHGDIKPDNIVITNDYKLALIDFGHAVGYSAKVDYNTGTAWFRPNEVPKEFTSIPYSVAIADIYSLAITLLAIMF